MSWGLSVECVAGEARLGGGILVVAWQMCGCGELARGRERGAADS